MIKNIAKITLTILLIIFLLAGAFLIILKYLGEKPIPMGYVNKVYTRENLEKKYTSYGEYKVNSIEAESNEELFSKYKIWYPSELEEKSNAKYPVVLFVNSAGVTYKKYESIFEHLASWGFVVVGNDDENTASGKSSSITLDYMISLNKDKESIFYNKFDTENMGISGCSQGGVGSINAVTNFDNSNMFTSIYTASTTSLELARSFGWNYDVTKIKIPYFMVATTKESDTELVSSLTSLKKNYNNINNEKITVMGRRKDIDNQQILTHADGYMTAWFRYTLAGDKEAKKVFSNEILNNESNWQDVLIKYLD